MFGIFYHIDKMLMVAGKKYVFQHVGKDGYMDVHVCVYIYLVVFNVSWYIKHSLFTHIDKMV